MANVLLGVTGSVAAIRTPQLFATLRQQGHSVRIVATKSALYFFDRSQFEAGVVNVDADEWPGEKYQRDDPVLHIELRRWAEMFVIAPLDANTLAKLAMGLSDNCLTCIWRAWDVTRPVLLAPAMNTLMWEHPLTVRHLRALIEDPALPLPDGMSAEEVIETINNTSDTIHVVGPITKKLACGDVGVGAMAEVDTITAAVNAVLGA